MQGAFEKKVGEENYSFLPDSLSGQEIHIYYNLMRRWFNELSAKNRYDDSMIQKLRRDWLNYISLIESAKTLHFLSMESWDEKNPKKSDAYSNDARLEWMQAIAIEDGFAAAIGQDAVKELDRIRKMDFCRFDKLGHVAPDGFEYGVGGKLTPVEPKSQP